MENFTPLASAFGGALIGASASLMRSGCTSELSPLLRAAADAATRPLSSNDARESSGDRRGARVDRCSTTSSGSGSDGCGCGCGAGNCRNCAGAASTSGSGLGVSPVPAAGATFELDADFKLPTRHSRRARAGTRTRRTVGTVFDPDANAERPQWGGRRA